MPSGYRYEVLLLYVRGVGGLVPGAIGVRRGLAAEPLYSCVFYLLIGRRLRRCIVVR